MSYTINSAKDSKGNEQLYMEVFNRLAPQIQQYKQQHGGDLEGAFGAVTGTPWPDGRSVKMSHGVPEMTKDRTVKSVLGKYVALPAAIAATAAFAPAALPALGHMAMAGGMPALAGRTAMGAIPSLVKGDWKGALVGGGIGAFTPGGVGGGAGGASKTGSNVMRDMLVKAGTGAVQGGVHGGFKGMATGAAGGVTSAIPGNVGKILNATGQSNIGGDVMSSILNSGRNAPQGGFQPQGPPQFGSGDFQLPQGQQQPGGFIPPTNRPQGW